MFEIRFPITGLGRLLGFQEVEAPSISRQLAQEGGEVVKPMHRPPLPPPPPPPRNPPLFFFLLPKTKQWV